jgi:hypothetical protein
MTKAHVGETLDTIVNHHYRRSAEHRDCICPCDLNDHIRVDLVGCEIPLSLRNGSARDGVPLLYFCLRLFVLLLRAPRISAQYHSLVSGCFDALYFSRTLFLDSSCYPRSVLSLGVRSHPPPCRRLKWPIPIHKAPLLYIIHNILGELRGIDQPSCQHNIVSLVNCRVRARSVPRGMRV